MELTIEYIETSELIAYEKNARIHSEEQVDQVAASITEFGFTNPVLVNDDNVLIAGHGRLAAAESIGMDQVPAIRLKGLTDRQQKALRIADNQLGLNATWDLDLLAAELSDLENADFDIDLIGFDDKFVSSLLDDDDGAMPPDDPGDENEEKPASAEKVEIIIGPYKVKVARAEFDKWETGVRAKVGFDVEEINRELKKRLGIKE